MVVIKYNEEENKWLPSCHDDGGIYFDGWLLNKLDKIKWLQKNNWDVLINIVGREGSGKSTLSFIIGQYLTNMGLTLDNLASGSSDALKKLQRLPNGSLIIIDEAELLFSSRETMTREQRQLTNVMMIIRQKCMCLILVSPSFFDLARYIAVDRSRFLIRTYTDKNLSRGRFMFWGEKKKRVLYELGKKKYGSYSKPKPNFRGRFLDYKLPFDAEYQKVKGESLFEAFNGKKKPEMTEEEKKIRDNVRKEIILEAYYNGNDRVKSIISTAFGKSNPYLGKILQREGEKEQNSNTP